jgi:hypothetical protein
MRGYKTYIVGALLAALSAARYFGFIDWQTHEALVGLLTGAGLMALRQGIADETAALPKPV